MPKQTHIQPNSMPFAVCPDDEGFAGGAARTIIGHRAGPALVAAGSSAAVRCAFRRLLALPNLRYMHGSLSLVSAAEQWAVLFADGLPNHIDAIYWVNEDALGDDPTSAYWAILARATRLGMISGRGVPRVWRRPGMMATQGQGPDALLH